MRFSTFFQKYKIVTCAAGLFVIGLIIIATLGSVAPRNFPIDTEISIEKNTTLTQTADLLVSEHVIKSAFLFKAYSVLIGGSKHVIAGDYLLTQPQSALRIAYMTTHGIYNLPKIKVTIPEGSNSFDMAWVLLKDLPDFNAPGFVALAKPKEGYLFPDTYYFYPNVGPREVVNTMSTDYEQRIASIRSQLDAFSTSTSAIIKMASIVEREATSTTDREVIAGILWKRIALGMPLSVDPPFYYILGKSSAELTLKDLASDSPYNLYRRQGLPPTPIDSPGMDAILATVNPIKTRYFYYLSGRDGAMHYAADLEGHLANKQKYM